MTDSEVTVNLDALRKSRAAFASVVTRSLRRFQKMLKEEEPSTLDLDVLAECYKSLETTEHRGLRTHDDICEEETDEEQLTKDEDARDSFNDSILAAKALLKRLTALKKAHGLAEEMHYNLDNLEETKRSEPDMDHLESMGRLTTTFADYQAILRGSTIDPGHQLWKLARDFCGSINSLAKKEHTAPAPVTTTIIGTPRDDLPSHTSLPKAVLPTFSGDIMEWAAFWEWFNEVLHSNPKLKSSMKLGYLRDSIKDPKIKRLLHGCDERDGYYEEMVTLLQNRFDLTSIIHSTHCRVLADLMPVPHVGKDITQLADIAYLAVNGLRRTK